MQTNWGRKLSRKASGVFVVAVMLLMAGHAQAATRTWTGAVSIDWNTDKNWSPKGIPGKSDVVIIGQSKTVNVPTSITVQSLTVAE